MISHQLISLRQPAHFDALVLNTSFRLVESVLRMIAEGRTSVHQAWWVLVFPLIALFLTVLSFSQLGEGLKDRFDPVLR